MTYSLALYKTDLKWQFYQVVIENLHLQTCVWVWCCPVQRPLHRLPRGSCHARREHVMNMYRQAEAAPCNLSLAGNYLRENGPPLSCPLPAARAQQNWNKSLIAGDAAAAARLLITRRCTESLSLTSG